MKILSDILSSYNIGDSLDFINNNFEILDYYALYFNNILTDSRNAVVASSYLDSISGINLDDINTLVNRLSSIINFVEINRTKWNKPFSIFYPDTFENDLSLTYDEIGSWLDDNYSVVNKTNGIYNYTTDQEAIVYFFINKTEDELKEDVLLKDSTECNVSDVKICGQCSVQYYSLENSSDVCSDYSFECQECLTPDCYYFGQPYTESSDLKLKKVTGSISAKIALNFTNTYETNIVGIKYKVNNFDRWEYNGLLS